MSAVIWSRNLALAHACPRCGARTRAGVPCKGQAMRNGRCYRHGGPSKLASLRIKAPVVLVSVEDLAGDHRTVLAGILFEAAGGKEGIADVSDGALDATLLIAASDR